MSPLAKARAEEEAASSRAAARSAEVPAEISDTNEDEIGADIASGVDDIETEVSAEPSEPAAE